MKNNKKMSKGITLIALVVTIIVLLLLAGISIQMLTGNNGILSRAGEAGDLTDEKQIEERVKLAYIATLAEGKGTATKDLLEAELNKSFGENGYELSEDLSKVTINSKEYEIGGAVVGDTGLVEQPDGTFKDSKGNEWVWIEVPKSVTASATTDDEIYTALRNYCATDVNGSTLIASSGTNYRTSTAGYTDEWYAWDTTNNTVITTNTASVDQKLLTNGCGLNYEDYNTTKSIMLNSIKDNGGFYIGKYEAGTATSGGTSTGELMTAVIKQNAYPYSYVTCSQAENLAKGFATDGKTASLLFGIQWDLVLKYLNVKGIATNLLTNDSTTWGNYYNNLYNGTDTNSWYSEVDGASWTKGVYNKVANGATLLTTGAHTSFSKQNIYDLAGNVKEWTLEKTSASRFPCASRGGSYGGSGDYNTVSSRDYHVLGDTNHLRFQGSTLLVDQN